MHLAVSGSPDAGQEPETKGVSRGWWEPWAAPRGWLDPVSKVEPEHGMKGAFLLMFVWANREMKMVFQVRGSSPPRPAFCCLRSGVIAILSTRRCLLGWARFAERLMPLPAMSGLLVMF